MTVIDRRYSVAEGTAIKAPVRVATTANITLSGLQTIDGVTVAEHDRVLVKNQTDQTTNGIYEASTGNWQRTKDFDGAFDIVEGTRVFVTQGTINDSLEFMVSTTGTITVGTSNITFEEFVSASTQRAESAANAADASADEAAATAATVASTVGAVFADTKTEAEAATIPTDVEVVTLYGIADVGDAPPGPYVSRLSEPSHAGKVLSNGVWRELVRRDGCYLEDFGGKNSLNEDGTLDNTLNNVTALTDAIDYCQTKRLTIIRADAGVWRFTSGGIEVPVGISIVGAGYSSSPIRSGTMLVPDYDEATPANPFIHFTGAGEASNSTGGGLQSMTLLKGAAKTGGLLLKITGVDDSHRPGYMSFRDLKLSGNNQGSDVDYCLIHDGSNLTTANTQGLRDVSYYNIYIDGWTAEGAQFDNATHARIFGMTCSPGSGSGTSVRISGSSSAAESKTTDMMVFGIQDYGGGIVMDQCHQCVLVGRATDLTVTSNCTNSVIQVTTENAITFSGITRANLRTTNHTIIYDGQDSALYVDNGQVVGPRQTGWAVPSGARYRAGWDPSTVTTSALGQIVAALLDDLTDHGLIGA